MGRTRDRWLRQCLAAILVALLLTTVSAAAGGCAAAARVAVQVTYQVARTGGVKVAKGGKSTRLLKTVARGAKLAFDDRDDKTIILIHYWLGATPKTDAYEIDTGEVLYVDINGRAQLKIMQQFIEVTAARGVATTITVSTRPSGGSYAESHARAPAHTGGSGSGNTTGGGAGSGGCAARKAPAPTLTLNPTRGPITTRIHATGAGFVTNGRVTVRFHATEMGRASTDCAGRFSLIASIPNQTSYGRFTERQFTVSTTEYNGSGTYVGNGDTAVFYLTG